MQVEDLKGWFQEDSREKNQVRRRWRLLVRLIRRTFEDGVVPEEVAWTTMVLIPKGRGKYLGIGIVEVVWKVCATVLNFLIKWIITLHDALHGFRAGGGGTGTATLEEKLAHQLLGISHKPMLLVFLDMQKA